MAGVSKSANQTHSFDIVFDGGLLTTTRASLAVELTKYFLYERQQIPLPWDQLNSMLSNVNEVKEKDPGSRASHWNKVKNVVNDLNTLFDNIRKAFSNCPEIEQISVLFGGTLVSPKESYIIRFPPLCPDADNVPLNMCQRNLFQQVINGDFLGSLKSSLAPTNMMVLLNAPRSSSLQWFLPKQSFKSPKMGAIIALNLHCEYDVPICHDLTIADAGELELSGLEPLNCSQCEDDNDTPASSATTDCADNSINAGAGSGVVSCDDLVVERRGSGADAGDIPHHKCNTQKRQSDGAATPFLPRFCKHHMLNYIYSSRKARRIRNDSFQYSDGHRPVCSSSAVLCSNSNTNNCRSRESSVNDTDGSLAMMTKRITLSPAAECATSRNSNSDCIWYQSPIVIKGLKEQDLVFSGRSL